MRSEAFVRPVLVIAIMASALLSLVSCTGGSAGAKEHAVADTAKCAPRLRAVGRDYGFGQLPVSSSQSAGYYGAQYAWAVSNTGSGNVGGAGQSAYLEVAIADLQLGLVRDLRLPGRRQAYHAAIRELRQMASLPDTDVTPHQQAEYAADVVRLNHFFGTKVPE
jgi:hypothetical protein